MFHQHELHGKYIPGNQFLVTEVLPMLFGNPWLPSLNQQSLKIWQNAQIHLRQPLVIGVTQRKAQKTIRRTSNWAVCSSHLRPRGALDVSDPQIGFCPENDEKKNCYSILVFTKSVDSNFRAF